MAVTIRNHSAHVCLFSLLKTIEFSKFLFFWKIPFPVLDLYSNGSSGFWGICPYKSLQCLFFTFFSEFFIKIQHGIRAIRSLRRDFLRETRVNQKVRIIQDSIDLETGETSSKKKNQNFKNQEFNLDLFFKRE